MNWHREVFEKQDDLWLKKFYSLSFKDRADVCHIMRTSQLDLPTVLNCKLLAEDPTCFLEGFRKVRDGRY